MTNSLQDGVAFLQKYRERFLEELKELLRIPSVSTDPSHKNDMQSAALWLKNHLENVGFDNVQIEPTRGHPVVYADHLHAGPSALTVLIYGHYDVQPPDPIDLWTSAPFDPVIRGDYLFARGASDMKGQILICVNALEAIMKHGSLPVNIKFLIEGEEEIGSPNLAEYLEANKAKLTCDFALNPDTGMMAADLPTIVYGLRGLAYFELRIHGPDHDLHSGMFGGMVHNPAQALCELIAGMHDGAGRVTLPHYYDSVIPLSDRERQELARLPISDKELLRQTGVAAMWGEDGYTPVERVGARPTLEICGLLSGYTGEGSKTVLPSWAMAKISMRLVPNQDPDEVHAQLKAYLEEMAPKTITWELKKLAGGPACMTDPDLPATHALADALETTWGVPPLYKREGGSVPVTADMQKILGIDSVLTGFGLPDDNIHSPNERLHLPTFEKGTRALLQFFYNLGRLEKIGNKQGRVIP
jgi:acetylornithine deacetylase/succinyl-diaminopimelate desuccinylase-like protein